jgi:hypothetical protein
MKDAQQDAMGGAARFATAAAALLVIGIAGSRPAAADMAIVQQDATPIVSQPGVGGRILTRVDAGFNLIVLGSEGGWLRVASPQLQLTGNLWVPAGRVGDVVADPTDLPLPDTGPAGAEMPRYQIEATAAGATALPSPGTTASGGQNGSTDVSAAVGRSAPAEPAASATRAAGVAAPSAAAASSSSPTSAAATGSATSASGNAVSSPSSTTSAQSNATTADLGNPTPALGNPTQAMGNPTEAVGNPTPAMGNSVVGFGNTNNATQ